MLSKFDFIKDILPKWTSIVVWIVIGLLICLNSLGAQMNQTNQLRYPSTHGLHTQVEIVGYRIVMSDDVDDDTPLGYGCWSELQIINENRFIDDVTRTLIVNKITKYELYGMSSGESPVLEIRDKKSGRISRYHIVKLR